MNKLDKLHIIENSLSPTVFVKSVGLPTIVLEIIQCRFFLQKYLTDKSP